MLLGLEGNSSEGVWTRWLFWLLFGSVLDEVADRSSDGERTLRIDERLRVHVRPDMPSDEDEFDPSVAWAPLRLALTVLEEGSTRRLRWEPLANTGIIMFAMLLHRDRAFHGLRVPDSLEKWCDSFVDPRDWDMVQDEPVQDETITSRLRRHRVEYFARLRTGLTEEDLSGYVSGWEELVTEARVQLVPVNSPLPALEEIVLSDVVELPGDRLVMLGTHPLRIRWIQAHLSRMSKYLSSELSDGLRLNPGNTELFFDLLDRTSPHGLPPFVVGADEMVALAMREHGWHEEYAAVRQGGHESREWLSTVDDTAIDEMVNVIVSYLETYPYKRDGVVVLLLSRDGTPRLPLRLAQRVRQRVPGVRIELRLFAPQASHDDIVRSFEEAFGDEETAEEQLFPSIQLVLKSWNLEVAPHLGDLIDKVDVALAPALFGTRTSLKNLTRSKGAALSGAFDPWLHAATHDLSESHQNVVRVLLPQQHDPMLETWSTLCVRQDGHSPVAPQEEANTDYFSLQVRFDRQQDLFAELHRVAHWVVTLDSFVGRDQIDALDEIGERPDVILVRTGVGKNEAYTLIVSSTTGRRFVVRRLERKLRNDLKITSRLPAELLATRLYEVGRHVVPGAVLRALGLGRAAHEIVGLVVSRYEVARQMPVDETRSGLEVWIGFDEHLNWFGNRQRMRADLGRFTFTVDESGEIRLDILVVESKYRSTGDAGISVARQQLDRTTELCRWAFGQEEPAYEDSDFWWQELAGALDQTSKVKYPASELPAWRIFGDEYPGLAEKVVGSVREGKVNLDDITGVAVYIVSDLISSAPPPTSLGSHRAYRLHRPELEDVLGKLLDECSPDQTPPADPEPLLAAEHLCESASDTQVSEDVGQTELSTDVDQGFFPGEVRGLGDVKLCERYERLLDVLDQHKVLVTRPNEGAWSEGPGFYVLRVVPRPGVTVDRVVNRVDEIQLTLALPRGDRIRASLDRGAIVFEVPKAPAERYHVTTSDLWQRSPLLEDRLVVPVGEDIDGNVVSLDFSSPDSPHLLVAGTTGSGKSVALEGLLRALCRYSTESVELFIVDPKGTELLEFADDAHTVGGIGMDAGDAIDSLSASVDEMQMRYQKFKEVRVRDLAGYNRTAGVESLPWRVVVLDEYADLTSDPDEKASIEKQLKRLTQKARAAGIHVIVATQRPSADVVSTTIRSNFPAQLALRVKTSTDSRIIMDETGAEALAGQGDAFLRTARGTTRIQVAFHAQL